MVDVWSTSSDAEEFPFITRGTSVSLHGLGMAHPTFLGHSVPQLSEALRSDLVIADLSGISPLVAVREMKDNVGDRQWRQRRAKVVLRTQDSHHQLSEELAVLGDIDYVAIAHGEYLSAFDPGRAIHVPCSLHQSRTLASDWFVKTPTEKEVDVVFPFQLYRGEVRNALAYEVHLQLKRLGHSSRFGFFRYYRSAQSPPALWEELGRARVILNLPLRNDLNIRNFEASLFPSWHVTVKVPDHDRVDMDWSNTVFTAPTPEDIAHSVAALLSEDSPRGTPDDGPGQKVLHHHTANDRIYQIVDSILGTSLGARPKKLDGHVTINMKPAIEEVYSPLTLLAASPTLLDTIPDNGVYLPSLWLRTKSTVLRLLSAPLRVLRRLTRHA